MLFILFIHSFSNIHRLLPFDNLHRGLQTRDIVFVAQDDSVLGVMKIEAAGTVVQIDYARQTLSQTEYWAFRCRDRDDKGLEGNGQTFAITGDGNGIARHLVTQSMRRIVEEVG